MLPDDRSQQDPIKPWFLPFRSPLTTSIWNMQATIFPKGSHKNRLMTVDIRYDPAGPLNACPLQTSILMFANMFGRHNQNQLTSCGMVISRSGTTWCCCAFLSGPVKLVIMGLCPATHVALEVAVNCSRHWKVHVEYYIEIFPCHKPLLMRWSVLANSM